MKTTSIMPIYVVEVYSMGQKHAHPYLICMLGSTFYTHTALYGRKCEYAVQKMVDTN